MAIKKKQKKTLKTALAAHHAHKARKEHEIKAEEAKKRKARSVNGKGFAASASSKKFKPSVGPITTATAAASASTKSRTVQPFEAGENVLLVGEGDFSFTLSLLSTPRSHDARRVVATSFDSERDCIAKYPAAKENIRRIREIARAAGRGIEEEMDSKGRGAAGNGILRFGVDAGDLLSERLIRKWVEVTGGFNKVWFGFPHVGQGHKDESRNILANQLLILRFMASAVGILNQGPKPTYVTAHERGAAVKGNGKSKASESDADEAAFGSGSEEEEASLWKVESNDAPEGYWSEGGHEGDDARPTIPDRLYRKSSPAWPPPQPSPRAGSLLITLRESKPYTLWSTHYLGTRLTSMLPAVAASAPALPKGTKVPTTRDIEAAFPEPGKNRTAASSKGQRPNRGYDLWRSFVFRPSEWAAYKHVRTIRSRSGDGGNLLAAKRKLGIADASENDKELEAACRTWEFGVRT